MPGRSSAKKNYSELAGISKKSTPKKVSTSDDSLNEDTPIKSPFECSSCQVLADLVKEMRKKQVEQDEEIKLLKDQLSQNEGLVEKQRVLEDKIVVLESNSGVGDSSSDGANDIVGELTKQVKELEKKVEDRTNRQLRKTLVFRQVPELDSEKTWSDTTEIVANKISELLDMNIDDARYEIDRCHRGGNAKWYKANKKVRPIYVAMLRWPTCEELVSEARKSNDIHIDYKYGPLTTQRRNAALAMRKELKRKGEICQGFIKFPAVLMGRKSDTEKYVEIRDFSDDDVSTYKK